MCEYTVNSNKLYILYIYVCMYEEVISTYVNFPYINSFFCVNRSVNHMVQNCKLVLLCFFIAILKWVELC